MEILALGVADEARVEAAAHLFDGPAIEAATRRFLSQAGHHLLVAYADGVPVGFVSGVEMTHPDKGTEMFVYELGVDEGHRRSGVGRALLEGLKDIARRRSCYGMWVLTGSENTAALATYQAAGAVREGGQVMLGWAL
jgi:ribosomal protein S18 acetylase RimI-like enzyme